MIIFITLICEYERYRVVNKLSFSSIKYSVNLFKKKPFQKSSQQPILCIFPVE